MCMALLRYCLTQTTAASVLLSAGLFLEGKQPPRYGDTGNSMESSSGQEQKEACYQQPGKEVCLGKDMHITFHLYFRIDFIYFKRRVKQYDRNVFNPQKQTKAKPKARLSNLISHLGTASALGPFCCFSRHKSKEPHHQHSHQASNRYSIMACDH